MGRYDAALSLLEGAAFAIRGHAKNREKALQDCKEIAAACLLLEAAGKVGKGPALMFMEDVDIPTGRVLDYKKAAKNIRALLEALPD